MLESFVAGLPTTNDPAMAPLQASAENLRSPDSKTFQFDGAVRLQRGDELLRADSIRYITTQNAYAASGSVLYQTPSLLLRADEMHGTTAPRQANADNIQYLLLDSRGNGVAQHIATFPDDRARLNEVTYSTCNPGVWGWQIRANEIALDQNTGVGRAHDVTLRLGGVPLLWLPYARFPIDERRHTGFLYPSISYASNRGLDVTVPYYLNLAPNVDATLYPRLLSRRGGMLGAELRYLTPASRGQIRVDYLPHDREADRWRGLLHARSDTRLAPNWAFHVALNRVSDDRYFEDLGEGLYASATRLLASSAYLRGSGDWWSAAIGADAYQIADPGLPNQLEPYRRLPRALFEAELPVAGSLYAGLRSEAVAFRKDAGLDGQRVDLYPYLDWNWQGSWWYVRPQLGYRYTAYWLDRDTTDAPHRGTPIGSLDSGLTFERETHWFGESYTQTLEPRVYYLRVPYRTQDDLPIFDTTRQSFDFWQLFSSNRFSGADRQMNANNLTVALTSRLLDADGVERLSASIGQIRYFEPQRVTLPGRAPTDYGASSYVAQINAALSERWQLHAAQQWNPNTERTDLSTIGLQRRLDNGGVLNASYRYRRDFLEQFDLSAVYPLNDRWRLVGRWNKSLREDTTLEALAGFEYDTCCVALRLLGRHFVHNTEGESSNAIMLELEFKGIGAFGQHAGEFLRHAILGYQ